MIMSSPRRRRDAEKAFLAEETAGAELVRRKEFFLDLKEWQMFIRACNIRVRTRKQLSSKPHPEHRTVNRATDAFKPNHSVWLLDKAKMAAWNTDYKGT